jgi:hypothetical protein
LATPVKSAANPTTGRKNMNAKYYPKLRVHLNWTLKAAMLRAPPPNFSLHKRIRRGTPPPPAKLLHHGETSLTSSGRQTQRPQRWIRFTPPTTTKLQHHRELPLTSFGRQTQRQQIRTRCAPPPTKLSHLLMPTLGQTLSFH